MSSHHRARPRGFEPTSVEHWPYELLAGRVWQLRHNLSSYDASYVALAELTSTTLVTLDRRLAGAPGVRCSVRTP